MSGYVYFVYYEELGNIFKIGMTKNLNTRISELNRGCPFELIVYTFIKCKNYMEIEKIAHKYFDDYLISHEWFDINKKQIDEFLSKLKNKE